MFSRTQISCRATPWRGYRLTHRATIPNRWTAVADLYGTNCCVGLRLRPVRRWFSTVPGSASSIPHVSLGFLSFISLNSFNFLVRSLHSSLGFLHRVASLNAVWKFNSRCLFLLRQVNFLTFSDAHDRSRVVSSDLSDQFATRRSVGLKFA